MRRLLPILFVVALAACSDSSDQVESLQVDSGDFEITLLAEGELLAAKSTPIMPPGNSSDPRTIAWMAPNFGAVKEGDVIVRFDVSTAELQATATGLELNKVDIQVMGKERELDRLLTELGYDLELVDIEKVMAERFVVADTLAYSRLEIIEASRNKDLLDYRSGHLEGKKGTYSDRQGAEIEVLQALRTTQESENAQHQSMIDTAAVYAPHDGFLVYEKRWHGQEIDVGSTVFPGNKIASIPNLDRMQAELKVPENEAVGLRPGQDVDLIIDAFPDRPLTGKITNISATAAPIDRENPAKYFSVFVDLDQSDSEWITPDAQVTAEIHISRVEDTIAIPNQALFKEGDGDWVYVRDGSDWIRTPVQLGLRGATRSEVVSGLSAGDRIALYPPEEHGS